MNLPGYAKVIGFLHINRLLINIFFLNWSKQIFKPIYHWRVKPIQLSPNQRLFGVKIALLLPVRIITIGSAKRSANGAMQRIRTELRKVVLCWLDETEYSPSGLSREYRNVENHLRQHLSSLGWNHINLTGENS